MTQQRRFYTVKGRAKHGLITHLCPTAAIALDSLKRFQREAVQSLLLLDPAGHAISPADLETIETVGIPSEAAPLAIGS